MVWAYAYGYVVGIGLRFWSALWLRRIVNGLGLGLGGSLMLWA